MKPKILSLKKGAKMSSTELVSSVFHHLCNKKISKKVGLLLENVLFKYLYSQLKNTYKSEINFLQEDDMISGGVIRAMINDLLINKDYSIEGLANYTGYPEDVLY